MFVPSVTVDWITLCADSAHFRWSPVAFRLSGMSCLLPSALSWAAFIIQIGCVNATNVSWQHQLMLLRGFGTQRRPQLHFWWSVPANETRCFKHEPKSDWILRRAALVDSAVLRSEHLTDIQKVYWRPRHHFPREWEKIRCFWWLNFFVFVSMDTQNDLSGCQMGCHGSWLINLKISQPWHFRFRWTSAVTDLQDHMMMEMEPLQSAVLTWLSGTDIERK